MKILEINTEKTWRGGERQTIYNILGLLREGHEVELLCRSGFPLEKEAGALNIPIHTTTSPASAMSFLRKEGKRFDILHAQTAKAQFYAVITKAWHGKPLVYTRRLDFVPKGFLTKVKYLRTDKTVAISPAIKKILEGFGIESEVISDAIVKQELNTARAKEFIRSNGWEGKKIVATTAALVPHKDPLTMVRAIAELKRSDVLFLHFGTGELKLQVEAEITRMQLGDRYKLMGFVDNVEDLFSVFDVFVMSSEEEGLGSSVLDAFIYKVPVASTDAGGLRDIVPGHGLVSPVKDHRALAENIHKLLDDRSFRAQLTEAAFRYVNENHSVEKIAGQYTSLFKRVSGS